MTTLPLPGKAYFQVPHKFIDIMPDLSPSGIKLLIYILRHTWGFSEYGKPKLFTNDEFISGRKRKDGTRLDPGTGLSKNSVVNGIESLEKEGLIQVFTDDSDKARVKKTYMLAVEGQDLEPEGQDLTSEVQNLDPGGQKLVHRGAKIDPRTEIKTLEKNSTDKDVVADSVPALKRVVQDQAHDQIAFMYNLKGETLLKKNQSRIGELLKLIKEFVAGQSDYSGDEKRFGVDVIAALYTLKKAWTKHWTGSNEQPMDLHLTIQKFNEFAVIMERVQKQDQPGKVMAISPGELSQEVETYRAKLDAHRKAKLTPEYLAAKAKEDKWLEQIRNARHAMRERNETADISLKSVEAYLKSLGTVLVPRQ